MRLDCIRHGETPFNRAHRLNGKYDEGITEEQKLSLDAIVFDSSPYDVIYCSTLRRCIETARHLKITPGVADARLEERSFGIFEGLTGRECAQRYPDDWTAFLSFDADTAIPEGESRAQHLERIRSWLADACTYNSVLAITHGGTLDFLYRLGTDIPVHGGDNGFHSGDNAHLSSFEIKGNEVKLLEFNSRLA